MTEARADHLSVRIWRWFTTAPLLSCQSLTWLAVGIGVALRLMVYAANRMLYRDERSLLNNLVDRSIFDVWTTLTEHQLAPPGFLVVERIMVRLPLPETPAARLLPLLCGIASMFLFPKVASRYLSRTAVPMAVALFAINDYVLYYCAEIKQYSSDVLLTLVGFLLAARPVSEELANRGRVAFLVLFGVVAPWFSFPMALVLGGVGTRLILVPALRKRWDDTFKASAICLIWGVSFVGCFAVGQELLDSSDPFMNDWWRFAFLPFPPRSLDMLSQEFWQIINIFINPTSLFTLLTPPYSALLDLGFFTLGAVSLGRRWGGGLFLVVAPILFALLASVLQKYPFHGRLLLYLVPSILLLVSEGIMVIGRRVGRYGSLALVAFVLFQPVVDVLWHHVIQTAYREFDTHGDLYPDVLDYFDKRAYQERLEKKLRIKLHY